jgi:hypothetical protein
MRNIIICRFENENDLNEFSKRNNIMLNSSMTEFNIHTHEFKEKKRTLNKKVSKEQWQKEWFNMPEYISNKQEPYAKINFIFNSEDLQLAQEIFDQNISEKTTSVWYPKLIAGKHSSLRVLGNYNENRYPIYIVSKGRSNKCYTSRYLSQMEVKHFVVVEPSDFNKYQENVQNKYATILELDMKYKDDYDTFDDLGNSKSCGPGAARNFCWEHSILNGHEWHWVFDDNALEGFHYMNNNMKQKCRTGAIFSACEDFVDRYENLAIAGLNYSMFCKMSDKTPAFVLNTRIYSFLLIRNDIPYRWRGRYNEDTDLSIRALKDGWCTVQFNAFLAGKCTTQKIEGGNTEEFYSHEGTYPKSKMLEDMHPDVAKVVWKFNRWHHQVNYQVFKQQLILKDGIVRDYKVNNYNMFVIDTQETDTFDSKSYLYNKYHNVIKKHYELNT